jgi:hypothetical protein
LRNDPNLYVLLDSRPLPFVDPFGLKLCWAASAAYSYTYTDEYAEEDGDPITVPVYGPDPGPVCQEHWDRIQEDRKEFKEEQPTLVSAEYDSCGGPEKEGYCICVYATEPIDAKWAQASKGNRA